MNVKATVFSVLGLVCASAGAHAGTTDFYWHNDKGFVSAQHCQVSAFKGQPFYISDTNSAEALKSADFYDVKAKVKHSLINRSIVRLARGKEKPGYKLVDVIGASETSKSAVTKNSAKRMDQGYVREANLKNLENYVLEIKSGVTAKTIPGLNIATTGTFWQLSTLNDQVQAFRCDVGGKSVEFMMFDVFTANSSQPIAHVGVNADQSGIFRSVLTHLPNEADKVLDSRMEQPPADSKQSLVTGAGSRMSSPSPLEVSQAVAKELQAQKEELQRLVPANKGLALALADDASGTQKPNAAEQAIAKQTAAAATTATNETTDNSGDADDDEEENSPGVVNSSQENVVCINEDTLAVRDESLENVLFRAEKNETVIPFQSWSSADTKKKTINGTEYTFIKIQFPEREGQNVGWLAKQYVRLAGECSATKKPDEKDGGFTPIQKSGPIKNIDDPACCGFPTIKRPTQSYLSGMRRFKAGRSKGRRLHAACDLYRYDGEKAVSIANGTVVRGLYSFYQGTYALDIQYPGGTVARYGEMKGKVAKSTATGAKVTRGQALGSIGTVNSYCCPAMLHFEMYKGTKKGALSTKGNKFGRRSDLMDPTKYLLKWEKNQFGTSY